MLKNSVRYKIVFTLVIIILPFLIIMNCSNIYYLRLSRQQIAQASVSATSLYIHQVDKSIDEIGSYLFNLSSVNRNQVNENIIDLNSRDETTRFYANYNLARQIQNDIALYKLASFLFVYTKDYDNYLYAYSSDTTFRERQALKEYTKTQFIGENTGEYNNWNIVTVSGQNYLLRVVYRNNAYIGAFINFNEIAKPLYNINNKYDGSFIFSDLDGNPLTNGEFVEEYAIDLTGDLKTYYLSGKTKKFVITGGKSGIGDFQLLVALPDKNILEGLNFIQYFILIISILAILILPFLLYIIYLWVLKPMRKLETAIGKIQEGDLDYRIRGGKSSREFMELYHAFNSMAGQIKALKINVYEEIIEKQKMELRYYQTQIKPHFLMNALATISNFAHMGRVESMYEFIYYLSNYIRYMFKSNLKLVPLKDEMEHVNNYLSMQELRCSGYLSHVTDIGAETEDSLIPPYIIHTFVENVTKHAMTFNKNVNVFIKAEAAEIDKEAFIRIIIEDDGRGMTEEAIMEINNDLKNKDDGKSIGIWNIKQTLKLIYSGRAKVIVSRSDLPGTIVEIMIPEER